MVKRKLKDRDVLDLYEICLSERKSDRAFSIFRAVQSDKSEKSLLETELGDRDRELWNFRQSTYGQTLDAKFQCHVCDEWLELQLNDSFQFPRKITNMPIVHFKEEEFQIRLPKCKDLKHSSQTGFDPSALCPGAPWEDPEFRKIAAAEVEKADPALEISFSTQCVSCDSNVTASFEICDFLWADIKDEAKNILSQIAQLASQFGWTESDCLSLSPQRRALYLGMIS